MAAFNPYDPRAAFLMGMGSDMLQAGGWSPMPVGMGAALGRGLQGGRRSMMDAINAKRLKDAAAIEEGYQAARTAKLDREAASLEQLETMIAGLPPEQQALARLDPKEFVKAQAAGGQFLEGTSTTNQMFNVYRDVSAKAREGVPISDQEWADARLAYDELTAPKITFDRDTGEEIWQRRNLPPLPERPGTAAPPQQVAQAPIGERPATEQVGGTTITRRQTQKPKMSKEAGQAVINARAAQDDLTLARGLLFSGLDEAGNITEQSSYDWGTTVEGKAKIPGSKGRRAYQAIRRSVEVLLRMRTGAAAPETEVDTYMDLYAPSPLDNDAAARDKMRALDRIFSDTLTTFQRDGFDWQGGGTGAGTGVTPVTGTPPQIQAGTPAPAGAARPQTRAEVEALPSGTQFIWNGEVRFRN